MILNKNEKIPETEEMNKGGLFEHWNNMEYVEGEYYVTVSGVLSKIPATAEGMIELRSNLLEAENDLK